MQEEKIVVDLDHPVWLSEPGYGNNGILKGCGNRCALGKLCIASNMESNYRTVLNIIGDGDVVSNIWRINDNGTTDPSVSLEKHERLSKNHWKAVRMVLEALAANPNVEFKGTKIKDVIKEKANV